MRTFWPVTPPGHNGSVVSAVIFDFYGTLAHFADAGGSNYQSSYQTIFAALGYTLEQSVLDDYFSRYDGVEHGEHSISEEAYEAWVRTRLRDLTGCLWRARSARRGPGRCPAGVDQGAMVPYPEAAATLLSLREAGLAIGVCSNWGWELDAFLDQVGLLALVDVGVTSARAGARKPHPDIYDVSVSALGVDTAEVVFVGDSWEPDVRGPRRVGMTAVHVWREEERHGLRPPALEPGDHRVGDLTGVLEIVDGLSAHGAALATASSWRRAAVDEGVGLRGRSHRGTAVLGQAGGQGLSVVVGERGEPDVGVAERAPPHRVVAGPGLGPQPTLVTFPVAVWGSEGETRT